MGLQAVTVYYGLPLWITYSTVTDFARLRG